MKREELKKFITNVTRNNINEKVLALPSHFYSMAEQVEKMEKDLRVAEAELDVMVSKHYRNISVSYKNVKGMTPTAINHQINCKEDVIEKVKVVNELKYKVGILKVKLKTLLLFSESMTNVGHNYRNESKTIKKGVA